MRIYVLSCSAHDDLSLIDIPYNAQMYMSSSSDLSSSLMFSLFYYFVLYTSWYIRLNIHLLCPLPLSFSLSFCLSLPPPYSASSLSRCRPLSSVSPIYFPRSPSVIIFLSYSHQDDWTKCNFFSVSVYGSRSGYAFQYAAVEIE